MTQTNNLPEGVNETNGGKDQNEETVSNVAELTTTRNEAAQPSQDTEPLPSTVVTEEDLYNGTVDNYGVMYSKDGKRLLRGHQYLSSYTIKEGTLVICDEAFKFSRSLVNITLPESLLAIGKMAFSICVNLEEVNFPEGLMVIGDRAFCGCTHLKNAFFPLNIKK